MFLGLICGDSLIQPCLAETTFSDSDDDALAETSLSDSDDEDYKPDLIDEATTKSDLKELTCKVPNYNPLRMTDKCGKVTRSFQG